MVARHSTISAARSSTPRQESGTRTGSTELRRVRGSATERRTIQFDRLIHERMRLGIVSALAVNESLSFGDLKRILNTTDGNLSVHARKLEEAEYVTCSKFFDGRLPKTEFRLTAMGRRALERYLDEMENLIRTTRLR